MDYRKLYEKTFGIKIPRDYDIHHIDGDHHNDSLDNLLLLPRALHAELHRAEDMFSRIIEVGDLRNFHSMHARLNVTTLQDLADAIDQVSLWMNAKDIAEARIDNDYDYLYGEKALYEQFRTK